MRIWLIIILFISCTKVKGQDFFDLSDTKFILGSELLVDVGYVDNSYELIESSNSVLDSIYFFLRDNWEVCVELRYIFKSDSIPVFNSSALAISRADEAKQYILNKGLEDKRITTGGITIFMNGLLQDQNSENEQSTDLYGLQIIITDK